MWTFKPAVWRSGTLTELPRPVTSLRIQDSWDYEQFKTPLADGDHVAGQSRNGVDLQIAGQVGSVAGAVQVDESSMLSAIEALRSLLDVNAESEPFFLVLYEDAEAGQFRGFAKCNTRRFESDLSDQSLFTYSAVIHASDPTLTTTPLAE